MRQRTHVTSPCTILAGSSQLTARQDRETFRLNLMAQAARGSAASDVCCLIVARKCRQGYARYQSSKTPSFPFFKSSCFQSRVIIRSRKRVRRFYIIALVGGFLESSDASQRPCTRLMFYNLRSSVEVTGGLSIWTVRGRLSNWCSIRTHSLFD